MMSVASHNEWRRDEGTSAGMTVASIAGLAIGLVVVAAMIAAVYTVISRMNRRRRAKQGERRQEDEEGMLRPMPDTDSDPMRPRPYHYIKRTSLVDPENGTAPLLKEGARSSQHWPSDHGVGGSYGGSYDLGRIEEHRVYEHGGYGFQEESMRMPQFAAGLSRPNYPLSGPSMSGYTMESSPVPTSPSAFSVAGVHEALAGLPSIKHSLRVAIPMSAPSPSTIAPYSAFVSAGQHPHSVATPATATYVVVHEPLPAPAPPPPYEAAPSTSSTSTEPSTLSSRTKAEYRLPSLQFSETFQPEASGQSVHGISPSSLADVTAPSGPLPSRISVPPIKGPRPLTPRRPDDLASSTTHSTPSDDPHPSTSSVEVATSTSAMVPVVLSASPQGPSAQSAWPSSPTASSIYSQETTHSRTMTK
ncbi:hypothetical protein ONZ45_g13282 [Pleurotus djamor]|nr:hypothetical protein ONZ45_g13282 [Pleurotus djamor]